MMMIAKYNLFACKATLHQSIVRNLITRRRDIKRMMEELVKVEQSIARINVL